MKSRTKNRLSEEKIRELVRLHFGQDCRLGEIKELKGGMFNAIYRIERLDEKDAVILKAGVISGTTLLTYERDIMPVEVECYRMIREQTGRLCTQLARRAGRVVRMVCGIPTVLKDTGREICAPGKKI